MIKKQFKFSVFGLNIKRYGYLLVVLLLLVVPLGSWAISSTSYIVDPSGTGGAHHTTSSTSYQLEGSLEPIAGQTTSTSYVLESGASFAGYCGDGFIDPAEDCEGSDLNSQTCVTQGFVSGTLTCSSACAFVTSACNSGGGGPGGGGGASGLVPSTPTFDASFVDGGFTYLTSKLFYGTKSTTADAVYVNASNVDVTYPTSSRWQKTVSLTLGEGIITIKATNAYGSSGSTVLTYTRRMIGDINQDGSINDYDLSLFVIRWGQDWPSADFNEDGIVDDYDLSLMVAYWTG